MYHQKARLMILKTQPVLEMHFGLVLYAQLLNKNFEQTITIAQKISGVET
jgi:hypothetical protein